MKSFKIIILCILFTNQLFSQRVPAEFEKQDGIVFTWLLKDQLENYSVDSVHMKMVENLVKDNIVYINYNSQTQKNKIEKLLGVSKIDISRVKFIKYNISAGSYPRDYGPEWIYAVSYTHLTLPTKRIV